MQVFKLFMKVLKKNIFTSMIYIIVFIAISIPMAKSASTEKTFKDTSLKIVVFDEDGTDASRALAGFIGKKHKLKALENDKDTIMQALYSLALMPRSRLEITMQDLTTFFLQAELQGSSRLWE